MKIFRIITALLLIAQMVFIYTLSSQNSDISAETSGGIIKAVVSVIYPDFEDLSEDKQEEIISSFQFIARKSAHFCLYGILGVLAFMALSSYRRILYKLRIFLSALICLTYAAADEFHQLYVPGRSGELRDILIDFSGALSGILFFAFLFRVIKPIYRNISFTSRNKMNSVPKIKADKYELSLQNSHLSARVTRAENLVTVLKGRISEQDKIIKEQKCEIERLNAQINATEPLKKLETKVISQAKLTPDINYGAAVIGKTVIEAAKSCNALTKNGEQEKAKELVNLILGRTEVAKAEILRIVKSDFTLDKKRSEIDLQFESAIDYFKSVMAQ